ncbi:MAG TPA: L-histidine N(alpha)-methyltransferase [Bacteroidetes bacterium]|nr:L-histidine N(alpha)-methyltransferase [Bacteroidota bacterium]HEX05161.1 L-histidine N(alpha)-methyltransferase [Bacteroidota bacterium]
MELEEYYPTACERWILTHHARDIADLFVGEPFNLIDLGSGDGSKTNVLLSELTARKHDFTYIPIDISEAAVQDQTKQLRADFPELEVRGIVAEYFNGLMWHSQFANKRNLVLFLGSNVGNFRRSEARTFMRTMWNFLQPGDLVLTGFDLKKNIDVMMGAYNDSLGITKQFNMNLLHRINKELGGNFDISKWRHYATYDLFSGAMESYLVSRVAQDVEVHAINQVFHFDPFEPIHTEYSYKFLESDIISLAEDTGFVIEQQYYDDRRYFLDSLWRVEKRIGL